MRQDGASAEELLVREFMADFVAAWPTGTATRLAPFFSEDATYHNMPMVPVRGRKAIADALAGFMAMGGEVRVDIINLVAAGSIVMTERVDYFTGGERTISLPVMGVCEIHDGVITAWRDYFDLNHLNAT